MLKIDIPITGFGKSGGYRVISRLATEWRKMGHSVRILSSQASGPPYFPTEAEILWLNQFGRRVKTNAPELLLSRRGMPHVAKTLVSLFLGLCRYSRSTDIVLANHSLTAWPTALCRTKATRCYYIQAYEPEFYAHSVHGRKYLLELQAKISYHLPIQKTVNSPTYLKYRNLRAHTWVPPGIDLSLFRPRGNIPRNRISSVTLGCIGRTEPDKGTKYVIDAFRILKEQHKEIRLRVAYGNLPQGSQELEGIQIETPKNDEQLAEFYRGTDIFVAPAIGQQGAPHYPVMEAMACGVPVITTGHMPSSHFNCWIVPERDAGGIVNAVNQILQNPVETSVRTVQALKDIQPFNWASVAQQMIRHISGN
jgi:glycosyltransferase involved in cell wall biosynthesis